jgi:short-subunit dehydrogenase
MPAQRTAPADRPFALVTGASSGIGRELAREFCSHDFDTLVVAEDAGIHQTAAELGTGHAVALQADLATREGNDAVVAALDAEPRRVSAAALNAGVVVYGPFPDTPLEDQLRLVELNVGSVVHLAHAVLNRMEPGGRLLITSSIASQMPGPLYSTYAASKSFLQSFAQAIRSDVADRGITVTALMPGPTDTEIFDRAGMTGTRVDKGSKSDPADVARAGFEAMMEGKDHVVAGRLMDKVMTATAGLMPDRLKAAAHKVVTDRKD